jgi:hypothetical protein
MKWDESIFLAIVTREVDAGRLVANQKAPEPSQEILKGYRFL